MTKIAGAKETLIKHSKTKGEFQVNLGINNMTAIRFKTVKTIIRSWCTPKHAEHILAI